MKTREESGEELEDERERERERGTRVTQKHTCTKGFPGGDGLSCSYLTYGGFATSMHIPSLSPCEPWKMSRPISKYGVWNAPAASVKGMSRANFDHFSPATGVIVM